MVTFAPVCLLLCRLSFSLWFPSFCSCRRSYLSCGAASTIAVGSWVGVKRPCALLGSLYHPLCYRQVWGADVGSGERPLVPGRLRAAIPYHIAWLWPVITLRGRVGGEVKGLFGRWICSRSAVFFFFDTGYSPYLVPVARFSVSVRWRGRGRPRARSVSVGPARFLAPGLLLGPALDSIISLRRVDCALTLAGVTCTLVVWSGSISEMQ